MPVNKRYFIDLMKDKKLSLRETARRMEIWPAALSRSLEDKRKMQLPEAVSLAKILSVPLAEVLINAGIEQAITAGRRCSIIGHVVEGAVVEPLPGDVIERIAIPDGLDESVVAIQAHMAGTKFAYADGWVIFLGPESDPTDNIGLYSLISIEGDGWVMGTVRRGYAQGTFNVMMATGEPRENVRILWARRAILTMH